MFLINRGSSVKINPSLSVNGVVLTASGMPMEQLQRQPFPQSCIRLFDSQLYFPLALKSSCKSLFTKLSSYPWYNPNHPDYNSREIKITEYRNLLKENNFYNNVCLPQTDAEINAAITSCIDFQNKLDVSFYTLPTPLINNPTDCFSEQLKWINLGLSITSNTNKKRLISLCISDIILASSTPVENQNLQIILDNLTTYDNIDGFFITIQRSVNQQYLLDSNLISSILELSYILGYKMKKELIFNGIDSLGFLALSLGATGLVSGYTNKEKRLLFDDYVDKRSGPPLPHFYSFTLIGDLLSFRDMKKIYDAGLLPFLNNDRTTFGDELFNALVNGVDISKTSWAETKNNVKTASLHRAQLLSNKVNEILSLNDSDKINYAKNWMSNAQNLFKKYSALSNTSLEQDFSHIDIWLNTYNSFLSSNNL